jgi:signal transduction histidine kinase
VSANAGMMEQVVMNLCINARDAMSQGGRLTLATTMVEIEAQPANPNPEARPGSFVCLSVTDTGCGMDETVLRRIICLSRRRKMAITK